MLFDERNFNQEEREILKNTINDLIESMLQQKDLQDHNKEMLKDVCERLNEKVEHNEQKIKPATITKMAKAKMKEDLDVQKENLSEVEVGLELIFKD